MLQSSDSYSDLMRILISNDDGIHSPALHALARMAASHGEVVIAAPASEQSATSHSITVYAPLRATASDVVKLRPGTPDAFEAYSINGTPADAVAVGLSLFSGVDLVLSGINLGANAGYGVMHSGTVAAARQAVAMGVPAIALSAADPSPGQGFEHLAPYLAEAIKARSTHDIPLLNVNFPAAQTQDSDPYSPANKPSAQGHPQAYQGAARASDIRWTFVSTHAYGRKIIAAQDPRERTVYWSTYVGVDNPAPGSDRWALANNYVSFTPLTMQAADMACLEAVQHS
ncbi:MAG: 5'/3'-nucleotidase SurE [Deinococcota bacterium]